MVTNPTTAMDIQNMVGDLTGNGLYYGSVLLGSMRESTLPLMFVPGLLHICILCISDVFHYGKGVKVSLSYLWTNQERRSLKNKTVVQV